MFRYNAGGGFNVPYGNAYNSKLISKKLAMLKSAAVASKLATATFYNEDFEVFLNKFTLTDSDFLFVDPPYDCAFTDYDQSPFKLAEQERLAEWLKECTANFLLITQKTKATSRLYRKFNVNSYHFSYRFNIKGRNSKEVEHLLVTNY